MFHDAEMVEVALLLPGKQAAALEGMACRLGLTVGQLIRRIIGDCLADEALVAGASGSNSGKTTCRPGVGLDPLWDPRKE